MPCRSEAGADHALMSDRNRSIPSKKLGSRSAERAAVKIDLSDRSRIDDHDHGKGRSTPKKLLLSSRDEFFNSIGPMLPFRRWA